MISWTMLSFLASSLATFSKASFNLSKAHPVAFAWTLKMLLYSSQSPLNVRNPASSFWEYNQCLYNTSVVPSITWPGDSRCHRPCIPSCFSFSASSRNLFAFNQSLTRKYSHIPRMYLSFPSILHNIPRCAFFSLSSYHCHFVNG